MKAKQVPQKQPTNPHSGFDSRVPVFSRKMLESTIVQGNRETFIFDADKNLRLRIIAEAGDVTILKDEHGNFYFDAASEVQTARFSESEFAHYFVARQRQQCDPVTALAMLFVAAIPMELQDLIPGGIHAVASKP
jgi:hypothetical protein